MTSRSHNSRPAAEADRLRAEVARKVEAFRSKKEVIKAQYSAAEAQVQISEAATGVGEEMADVGLAMQRALDKTENMKARADAVGSRGGGDVRGPDGAWPAQDDIDHQLEQLGRTSAVDDELAKMKAELGAGGAPAQLEQGGGQTSTEGKP